MQKFVKTDMNECDWGHRLTTDFCEERSEFVHKIYYKDQPMHFGFMEGIFITYWLPTRCSHLRGHLKGGKIKNTNVFMCQDHSTDKNHRVLVRIPVKW